MRWCPRCAFAIFLFSRFPVVSVALALLLVLLASGLAQSPLLVVLVLVVHFLLFVSVHLGPVFAAHILACLFLVALVSDRISSC